MFCEARGVIWENYRVRAIIGLFGGTTTILDLFSLVTFFDEKSILYVYNYTGCYIVVLRL